METKKTTGKTIGDRISEEVKAYKGVYKTLVELGNKQPAAVIADEIAAQVYIWQSVARELKDFFESEKARLEAK